MQRKLQHLIAIVTIAMMCLVAAAQPQGAPNNPFVPGDVNEDRLIDIADVNGIINTMLGLGDQTETQLRNADFNHDGQVDIADVNGVINIMLGKGYAHADPMSLVVETRGGSRDVFPLADNPQLSFSGPDLLVESRYTTGYYGRDQLYQIYYMPYTQAKGTSRARRAPMAGNPNQYAVYIYRNDNDFNAHLNIDIESIRFSTVGTDSTWYDNALVQEVWTSDTVYRTPIAAVDSITFEAPRPILRDNLYVVNEDNVGYVTYSDDNTIRFMSSTPAASLPVQGQVIVSELFVEPVADGFAGRVASVNTLAGGELEYVCDDVTFDDIFEQLVLVAKATNDPTVPGQRVGPRRLFGLDNPNGAVITLDEVFPEVELGYDEFPVSLKYHPVVTIDYVLYVQRNQPKHIRLVVGAEHTFTPQFKLEQTLGEVKKTAWLYHKGSDWTESKPKEVSIGHGFKLMWDLGVFAKMAGKISLNGSAPITVKHALGFDYHGYGYDWDNLSLVHDFGMDLGRPDLKLSVSGSASAGIAALIGVNFVHRKLASISGTLNVGPKFTASLDLSAMGALEDPTWYNALKDSKVKGDINIGLDVDYMILNKRFTMTPGQGWPGVKPNQSVEGKWDLKFEWDIPWKEWKLLPSFTTPTINYCGNNRVLASTRPDDNLIVPVWVGMGLFDRQGNKVAEDIDNGADHFYWGKSDSRPRQFSMTATSPLTPNEYYTCRPLVRIMDLPTMTAGPAKEFRTANLSVTPLQLNLSVGETREAQISGCSGVYEVNNPKKDVVDATVVGSTLKVTALKAGTVTLAVGDKETGETQDVAVAVLDGPPGELVLSTGSVEVNEGQTATVSFYSGSGQYEVECSTPTVATATLQGEGAQQVVLIQGIKQGVATVVVRDTQFDKVATISVTVTDNNTQYNLTEGLVAYYPFNGNANDMSGHGNHGTVDSNVSLTTGVHGEENGAYHFGGFYNRGRIKILDSESLHFDKESTVAIYVRPTDWKGMDGWGSFVSRGAHCFFAREDDRDCYILAYDGSDEEFHAFCGTFVMNYSEDVASVVSGSFLEQWIHVCYVFNGINVFIYINGELISTLTITNGKEINTANGLNIYLGMEDISGYSYPMNGDIDELRIYNRALTPEEVKALSHK